MRLRTLLISLALGAGVWVYWWFVLDGRYIPSRVDDVQPVALADDVLDRTVSLSCEDEPFADALKQLAREADADIWLNESAFADAGFDPSYPITIDIQEVSLREMLNHIVLYMDLMYIVDRGRIEMTTYDDAYSLKRMDAVQYAIDPLTLGGSADGCEQLADLVTQTIAPLSWSSVGGDAEIHMLPGGLLILQHRPEHDAIAKLLSILQQDQTKISREPIWLWDEIVDDDGNNSRVFAALDETTEIELSGASIDELADLVAKRHNINVVVDRRALDDIGFDFSTTITFEAAEITLRSALRLLLRELDLSYMVKDGCLQCTTTEVCESELAEAVYPIEELIDIGSTTSSVELIEMITDTIAPMSWNSVGGTGAISCWDGRWLVVAQTRDVHDHVVAMLYAVRHYDPASNEVVSIPPDLPATAKIKRLLHSPVEWACNAKSLDELADRLEEKLHIKVVIDRRALDDENLDLRNASFDWDAGGNLGKVLRSSLRKYDLAYVIRDEVLVITSIWDEESHVGHTLLSGQHLVDPDFGLMDSLELAELIETFVGVDSRLYHHVRIDESRFVVTSSQRATDETTAFIQWLIANSHVLDPIRPQTPDEDQLARLTKNLASDNRWERVYAAYSISKIETPTKDLMRRLSTAHGRMKKEDPAATCVRTKLIAWSLDFPEFALGPRRSLIRELCSVNDPLSTAYEARRRLILSLDPQDYKAVLEEHEHEKNYFDLTSFKYLLPEQLDQVLEKERSPENAAKLMVHMCSNDKDLLVQTLADWVREGRERDIERLLEISPEYFKDLISIARELAKETEVQRSSYWGGCFN